MSAEEVEGADAAARRFEQLLDKQGLVRLLDVFLTYETLPQTQASLTDLTELDQSTVSRRANELDDLGIVERVDGTSPQEYRLNVDHPSASALVDVHTDLQDYVREVQNESEEFNTEEAGPYDGSPFVELFRYPTNVRLLTAFLQYPDERLRLAEISELAMVDYGAVCDNIDLLCHVDIIQRIESRVRDEAEFALNHDHPAKDGFEQVIEIFRTDEPTTPTDKDAVSPRDSIDRAEDIRQRITDLVGDTADRDIEQQVAEEWTQDATDSVKSYSLQLRAAEVTADTDSSGATTRCSEPETENNGSSDTRRHRRRFGREGFTGTSHRSPEQTSTAAA